MAVNDGIGLRDLRLSETIQRLPVVAVDDSFVPFHSGRNESDKIEYGHLRPFWSLVDPKGTGPPVLLSILK